MASRYPESPYATSIVSDKPRIKPPTIAPFTLPIPPKMIIARPFNPIDNPICGLTELNAIPTKIPAIPPIADAITTVRIIIFFVSTPRILAVSKLSAVALKALPAFVLDSQIC